METYSLFMPQIEMACAIIETPYCDLHKVKLPGVKINFGKQDQRTVVELRNCETTLSCVYNELLQCEYVLIFPDNNDISAENTIIQINNYIIKYHIEKGLVFLSVAKN